MPYFQSPVDFTDYTTDINEKTPKVNHFVCFGIGFITHVEGGKHFSYRLHWEEK